MPRHGHSVAIGKFAKVYRDRQRSEIRVLGELLRREQNPIVHTGQQSRTMAPPPARPANCTSAPARPANCTSAPARSATWAGTQTRPAT